MNRTTKSALRPWKAIASLAILGLFLNVGARFSSGGNPAVDAPQAVRGSKGAAAPCTPQQKLTLLFDQAQQVFRKVATYSCFMVKQERIHGRLEPENLIELKVRQQPFSVYMRWQGPRAFAGQEVCYVAGRNNNMMRVHAAGVKGLVGFVSINPTSPLVLEHSRHRITEAGLGSLIDQLVTSWRDERTPAALQIRFAEYEYNRRRCERVEIIRPERSTDPNDNYRTVIYIDRETHLPIRLERYDWPRSRGDQGDLLECYSYLNFRFNVEIPDKIFNH
jgi:hypothetical protein